MQGLGGGRAGPDSESDPGAESKVDGGRSGRYSPRWCCAGRSASGANDDRSARRDETGSEWNKGIRDRGTRSNTEKRYRVDETFPNSITEIETSATEASEDGAEPKA